MIVGRTEVGIRKFVTHGNSRVLVLTSQYIAADGGDEAVLEVLTTRRT